MKNWAADASAGLLRTWGRTNARNESVKEPAAAPFFAGQLVPGQLENSGIVLQNLP
ncbi:hypothetical protein [Paenibacillus typhae]|uniref:hypothetical protein n=1 Tax=Paenibacillus typhae TaxID=1174501 RepID=UPI001428A477|nr:hypothetical protein [Paenibacillus typhae]